MNTLADKEHALNEYAHLNILTELTREHTQLVHFSDLQFFHTSAL